MMGGHACAETGVLAVSLRSSSKHGTQLHIGGTLLSLFPRLGAFQEGVPLAGGGV